ncbi:hypothetical protein EES43_17045 [Streptomyces sp. ADI96-02]|nr:hypothetical protein [Streptomyces sp. ADI96-02]RPK60590.1 hypothetical protein EES43_17045 [Streptomyces sp. ADI96-02]
MAIKPAPPGPCPSAPRRDRDLFDREADRHRLEGAAARSSRLAEEVNE